MSMVKRVLLLLKMEAREDMRAASITASIRPRKPVQRGKVGCWWNGERGERCKVKSLSRHVDAVSRQSLFGVLTIRHD